MGNVPERDEARDKELIADYKAKEGKKFKFSTSELVGKHKISLVRIYQICDKYGVSRRTPKKVKKT